MFDFNNDLWVSKLTDEQNGKIKSIVVIDNENKLKNAIFICHLLTLE